MKSESEHIPVYSLHNFSSSERGSQQFQVEVFDANRHFSVKYPHRHDFFEVLYLSKGSGFHVIDGNKYEIKPPCVFFMSPGQAHKIDFSNDIEGYIFIFTAEFYLINQNNQNRLIEFPFFFTIRQDNPPLILNKYENVVFLESLFKNSISELQKGGGYSIELLRSILDLILTSCSTLYKTDENTLNKGKGHIMVKKFFQLVEENYHKKLSVNEYADRLAVTPNHLTQTVNQLTGKTSSQIIRAKQVLEIKRLLVHTNLSVTEIANLLNFPDQSYFAKFFKRETGIAPLQYRVKSLK
ncbi:Transcriptional regulator, AraC family [hydrothermal vent metagenome]|uniref:Transcriptional regulator, AraC family n=1 Tax=hydrothermal vent metagenome TaxID=652676 RepID=A0A3B0TMF1_9ZZZZ